MQALEFFKIDNSWIVSGIVYSILITITVLVLKNLPKISTFLGEVKGELRKASWPWDSDPNSKGIRKYKELIDSTIVVLIAVVLLAGFVQFWDFIQLLVVGFLTEVFL